MTKPLESTRALAGIPEFIELAAGPAGVTRAFQAADVPEAAIGKDNHFITHQSLLKLFEEVSKATGDIDFSLMLAPGLDMRTWGPFGSYVTAGRTHIGALQRLILALPYHGSHRWMELTVQGDEAHFRYAVPSSGLVGYRHYAIAAVAYAISIFKLYFPSGWRPLRIEFDFSKPRNVSAYEERFQCPILFDAPRWAVVIQRETEVVECPARTEGAAVTLSDLRRMNRAAPSDFQTVVKELIRVQLLDGQVNVDRTCEQLNLGVRTLQRRLSDDNLVFRDLVLRTRIERASELLRETDESISDIATALGYSDSAHFARAFKQIRGTTPRQARKAELIGIV